MLAVVAGFLVGLGVLLGVVGRSIFPFGAGLALGGLVLLAAAGVATVRALWLRRAVPRATVLAAFLGLTAIDLVVCTWILITAGLSHTRAGAAAPLQCAALTLVLVVGPTVWLALVRRRQVRADLQPVPGPWGSGLGPLPRGLGAVWLIAAMGAVAALAPVASGWSPLLLAARLGSPALVRACVRLGADPGSSDPRSGRALLAAVEAGSSEVVGTLLDLGADPDQETGGVTPLGAAVRRGDERVVRTLLDRGARAEKVDAFGEPLWQAVSAGHASIARELLAAGADPNRVHVSGTTPLMAALGYPEAMRTLLASGADPDALSDSSNHWIPGDRVTALMIAARIGAVTAVDLLLGAGARRELRSARGETAADLALRAGHRELATRLRPSE